MSIPTKTLFSNTQLAKLVADTLPTDVKPGEKVVVGTVDLTGAQVVVSFKLQSESMTWELQAAARHDWNGDNAVGAKILLRWP